MKQVTSICMVAVRQIVWKLLTVAVLLVGVDAVLFWRAGSFDIVWENVLFSLVFWVAWAVLAVVLMIQGTDSQGKLGYTLRRLSMGEAAVTTMWAVVHMACLMILWMVQLLAILAAWNIYGGTPLELFVSFYRSEFLHSLLPLQDISLWVCMFLQFATVGFGSAYMGFLQRKGKRAMGPIVVLAVSRIYFAGSYSNEGLEFPLMILYGLTLGYYIYRIWGGDYEET